ncbi:MAG: YigZ family protein [Christensenellales bacterium]
MNGYETVQNSTTTEEIKRSRFITEVRRVKAKRNCSRNSARSAKVFGRDPRVLCGGIRQIRTCGAVFGRRRTFGDCGQPILEAIKQSGVKETLVAVVRYFGGIKLGAGGLTRAYAGAAMNGLKISGRVTCTLCDEYRVRTSFATAKKISGALERKGTLP